MNTDQKIIWTPIPQILEISFFNFPHKALSTHERTVKDYEIDFFLSGNGKIHLDGICYDIMPYHIMFRRPGQRCSSEAPYSCYVLTLNFFPELNLKNNYLRRRSGDVQPFVDHPCFNNLLPYFSVRNASTYQKLFSALCDLESARNNETHSNADVILTDLFLNMLTDSTHRANSAFVDSKKTPYPQIQELCSWIRTNLHQKIKLEDMSKIVNMHPNYLHRVFSKQMGISPNDYVEQCRLEQACQLLINSNNTIEWISEQNGFNSAAYFTKRFKKHFNITPNDFRKNHK